MAWHLQRTTRQVTAPTATPTTATCTVPPRPMPVSTSASVARVWRYRNLIITIIIIITSLRPHSLPPTSGGGVDPGGCEYWEP